jgi:hypothetical protein
VKPDWSTGAAIRLKIAGIEAQTLKHGALRSNVRAKSTNIRAKRLNLRAFYPVTQPFFSITEASCSVSEAIFSVNKAFFSKVEALRLGGSREKPERSPSEPEIHLLDACALTS